MQAGLEEILFLVAQGCPLCACERGGQVHTTLEVLARRLQWSWHCSPGTSSAMPPVPDTCNYSEHPCRTYGRTPFSTGQTLPTCMWHTTIFVHRCADARHPPSSLLFAHHLPHSASSQRPSLSQPVHSCAMLVLRATPARSLHHA